MPCKVTTEEGQTEFEFFQQLLITPDPNECCGPVCPLGFIDPAQTRLINVLKYLDTPDNYLDTYLATLVDSQVLLITMCAKHWIKHSMAIGTAGTTEDAYEWLELAYLIYTLMCATNNWDYKEITNYVKTAAEQLKKD